MKLCRLAPLLCLFWAPAVAAEEIDLGLANEGARTLRCQIIYAHWVTGELPTLEPGSWLRFTVERDAATREIYVPREPDGRRMMLEGVLCGADDDWGATLTLLDLEAVKRSNDLAYERRCSIEVQLTCSGWEPEIP